jgi:hypothetical protein
LKSQTGRVIADGEYWVAVQRLWSFDEPRWRWSRLVKNCQRLLALLGLGRETAPGDSDLQEVTQLIDVYGWQPTDQMGNQGNQMGNQVGKQAGKQVGKQAGKQPALPIELEVNRLVSIILALADVRRFHSTALNLQSVAHPAESGCRMLPVSWRTLIEELIKERGLSSDEEKYLCFCVTVCPDWLRLLKPGPWNLDSRAKFMTKFLRSILNNHRLFDT